MHVFEHELHERRLTNSQVSSPLCCVSRHDVSLLTCMSHLSFATALHWCTGVCQFVAVPLLEHKMCWAVSPATNLFSLVDLSLWIQDRVAKLQELYMRDQDQSKAITVHENLQQSNLLQLATPEMLAISKPPAGFAVTQDARPARIVPALHEIETLRREKNSLREQVGKTCAMSSCFAQPEHHILPPLYKQIGNG